MKNRRQNTLTLTLTALALALLVAIPLGIQKLSAATAAETILNQQVTMTWAGNSANDSDAVVVGTNHGGLWIATNDVNILPGSAPNEIPTSFENLGNFVGGEDYAFSYIVSNTGGGADLAANWTIRLSNEGQVGASNITVINVAPGAARTIWIYALVDAGEVDGANVTIACVASNAEAHFGTHSALYDKYTGLNGIDYGGNMGDVYGVGNIPITNIGTSTYQVVMTVQAATMTIVKNALQIENPGPFSGNTTEIFPGGRITFRLDYENSGSTQADNVRIVDLYNTNYLELIDSFATNDYQGTFNDTYTLGNGVSQTIAADGDGMLENDPGTADYEIVCVPRGNATGTGSSVAAGVNGSFFYQVYLR